MDDVDYDRETLVGEKVIVLQPGSCNLRLGRASDPLPHSVPHVIAYRTDAPHTAEPDDTCVLRPITKVVAKETRDETIGEMAQYLKLQRQALGLQRTIFPTTQYAEFNAAFQPQSSQLAEEIEWSNISQDPRFVIGDKALYVPPGSPYCVYKPMKHGRLNVGPSQSLQSLLDILEDLWTQAIYEVLEIKREDLKNHNVILLIADTIARSHAKELMNLLLKKIGFANAVLHQESVCAAFGAGLSSACVVDVGDEKSHVCCVEDGVSNPFTRLTLNVGGSDITRLFYELLLECHFPYRDCNRDDRLDGLLVEELKETWCHLDVTSFGVKVNDFQVIRPDRPTKTYTCKLADQVLYPPMSLFFPGALGLPQEKLLSWQLPQEPDCEDYLDESYWIEVGQQTKASKSSSQEKEKSSELVQMAEFQSAEGEQGSKVTIGDKVKDIAVGLVPSLDDAIHMSIDCASSIEMKRKLYGSVLVVGGGLAFQGVASLLQARLYTNLPAIFQKPLDAIEVSSNPRDMDPTVVAWKGAAVLSCLDAMREMWIEQEEWKVLGVRLLRERASFCW